MFKEMEAEIFDVILLIYITQKNVIHTAVLSTTC